MASGRTQRVRDNAFHLLSSWRPDSKSLPGRTRGLKTCISSRRERYQVCKRGAVLRIVLLFCVSSVMAPLAWATPSPTPSHIISRIPRQPVNSTAIAKVGYSKRRHVLEVEFVNGAVYRYLDVPVTVYRDLMSAESKARFYDSNIKGHYRSVLIRSRQKEQVTK